MHFLHVEMICDFFYSIDTYYIDHYFKVYPRFVLIRYNVTDSASLPYNFQEKGAFHVAIQGSIKGRKGCLAHTLIVVSTGRNGQGTVGKFEQF